MAFNTGTHKQVYTHFTATATQTLPPVHPSLFVARSDLWCVCACTCDWRGGAANSSHPPRRTDFGGPGSRGGSCVDGEAVGGPTVTWMEMLLDFMSSDVCQPSYKVLILILSSSFFLSVCTRMCTSLLPSCLPFKD